MKNKFLQLEYWFGYLIIILTFKFNIGTMFKDILFKEYTLEDIVLDILKFIQVFHIKDQVLIT